MAAILNYDPDVAFAGARVLFVCVIVFQWDELIVCASLIAFMDIEETSAVKLLYADEFELYTVMRLCRYEGWVIVRTL